MQGVDCRVAVFIVGVARGISEHGRKRTPIGLAADFMYGELIPLILSRIR
jgi:hypothetical protein